MPIQIPKGLFDILPYGTKHNWCLTDLWQYVERTIRKTAHDYGYKELRTPIFERTELFQRGVGETSDIVSKEMYTFEDKAKRSMSLRPEGTASTMRTFVENSLHNLGGVQKLYYIGPMFRYERPQSGRYRQHHQFGVEAIGSSNIEQDVEIMDLLLELYRRLGLKNLTLTINSLGDAQTRESYKKALKDYFKPNFDILSDESKIRYEKNPLRILDSKAEEDKPLIKNAPSILEFLSTEAKKQFDDLQEMLTKCNIPYQVNKNLVRGLDYYTSIVFEVLCSNLGAQNSIGGGGRYDNLLKDFGGPALPATGFGTGMERIIQAMVEQQIPVPTTSSPFVYIIPLGEEAQKMGFLLATKLRHNNIPTDIDTKAKKIQKSLQHANKQKAKFCLIIGEEEIKNKKAQLKNLDSREQEQIDFNQIALYMEKLWKTHIEKII